MRNGIQECFAQTLGLSNQTRLLRRLVKALAIDDQSGLTRESFEEVALVGGRRGLLAQFH